MQVAVEFDRGQRAVPAQQREGQRALAGADLDDARRPACGSTASTILSITLRSCRKFWPRCFLARFGEVAHAVASCRRASRVQVSDRGEQAGRIGHARAGQVQRRAMVDRDARIGQAQA